MILTIPFALYNIHYCYKRGEWKQTSVYEGCIPLISPFLLFFVTSYWVHHRPLLEAHPRLVTFTSGVIFSNIVVSFSMVFLYCIDFVMISSLDFEFSKFCFSCCKRNLSKNFILSLMKLLGSKYFYPL